MFNFSSGSKILFSMFRDFIQKASWIKTKEIKNTCFGNLGHQHIVMNKRKGLSQNRMKSILNRLLRCTASFTTYGFRQNETPAIIARLNLKQNRQNLQYPISCQWQNMNWQDGMFSTNHPRKLLLSSLVTSSGSLIKWLEH